MISLILAGLTIGIASGLKPGALGVYVIHQTMTKGKWAGLLASLAPLITDGPVILLSIFLTHKVADINWLVGSISLVGGFYLLLIAYRIVKTPIAETLRLDASAAKSSLFGAIKLNLVNPAPYVFWFSIGSAYIATTTLWGAVVFALCTTSMLCLTKFLVGAGFQTLGSQLNTKIYRAVIKLLAIPLVIFSLHLFYRAYSVWSA